MINKEILLVDNLKCGGCATNVEQTLLIMKGVVKVIVKVEEGMIEIVHDDQTDLAAFQEKLNEMGYPKQGTSTLMQKGKSYVSCAIGKMKTP